MKNLIDFLKNGQLFIIPISVLIITQITKVLLESKHKKKIKLSYFGHYGGMPSSHTALFISLTTIIFYNLGWKSPIFALSLIICAIMMRDALGIRHHLGNHGLILKQLIKEHEESDHTHIKHDQIVTRLGHTPMQVFLGAIFGFLLTTLFYLLIN
ncbi:MAG: divergent PAP2 family protein [Patescibacteria group bacterium]